MLLLALLEILVTATALESNRSEEESWQKNFTSYIDLETMNDISDENSEKPRISLCCHINAFLIEDKCAQYSANETEALGLPTIYGTDFLPLNITTNDLRRHFSFVVRRPCADKNQSFLIPYARNTEWYLLSNGSILRTDKSEDRLVDYRGYCLARVKDKKYRDYLPFRCASTIQEEDKDENEESQEEVNKMMYIYALSISVPFLIATYLVYWLLPGLNNMHGLTLRGHVGCMAITNGISAIIQLILTKWQPPEIFCSVIALIVIFSFSASFFWLNVMCFDIWRTFWKPLRRNVKQQEKRRFIIYSIYAWGNAFIHTAICATMHFVPNDLMPKGFIRPEFPHCWFNTALEELLYFWVPMSIIIICNIYLFISTALKILRYKRNIAQHLKDSETNCHNDNRQRFSLYLKLSVVMGISWSMEIILWFMEMLLENVPNTIWHISNLTNILQGLIIFIMCVWKKIWNLVLKRLGYKNRDSAENR